MTADQFKEARLELGLSQAQLGEVLDTSARTVRKWENGERAINPVAAQAMIWMTDWVLDRRYPAAWPKRRK